MSVIAYLEAAERRADRLAETVAVLRRAGFHATMIEPVDHIDDCDCEHADACTIEEVDPRCTLGEPFPGLMMDDGAYTLAVVDLSKLAAALKVAQLAENDDVHLHALVDAFGDITAPTYTPEMAG